MSMGDTISDLARWITEQVLKHVARIVLAQRTGAANQVIDEWTLAELVDAGALAQVIYAAAVRDAQALRVSLAYGVFAIRSDRPDPVGCFGFRIECGAGWLQPSDSPDERGVMAMLMRHSEASARLSLGHSRGILDQYEHLISQNTAHHQQLLNQAYQRIAALEAREMEALELRNKLQSMARERELELKKLEQSTQMRMFAMDRLGRYLPLLLGRLGLAATGGAGADIGAAGTIEVLEQLISSITQEQLAQLAALLRPEQRAMLAHLYDVLEARHKTAAADAPPPAAASPTPEVKP
jgi:hypothetical protein